MTTIRVELDAVRKYRNTQEWRNVQRASALWEGKRYEAVGDGWVIRELCIQLLAAAAPENATLEVWRGSTPVFRSYPIQSALKRGHRGTQPAHLRKHREKQQ